VTPHSCTRAWEIDAYREGRLGPRDAESVERHLRACAECSARMKSDERLRALGLALPVDEPDDLALHRLRARVLRDAAAHVTPRSGPSWRAAAAAGLAVACAAGLAVVVHRTPSPTPAYAVALDSTAHEKVSAPARVAPEVLAGTVAAETGARWTQARDQGRERVGLQDGKIRVHVRPQGPDESFVVALPDGELEVRGTTFEVTVRDGETSLVSVQSGVVELRLRGRPVVRLVEGDTWTDSARVSASPALPTPSAPPRAAPAASTPVASPDGDEGASSYADALGRLREGRYEDAAAAFHAIVEKWPGSSQAEDASFLEAVALARAGRPDAAGLAAERHLASFPRSFHKKEAAILVDRAAALRARQNP